MDNKSKNMIVSVSTEKQSIFYKIKAFIKNIFRKKTEKINNHLAENKITDNNYIKNKQNFKQSIKNIENEETILSKLQTKYSNNEISVYDLNKKQRKALIDLYKKQNEQLKKSNKIRKEKLKMSF